MVFPLAFFDVTVHLVIHMTAKVTIVGLVQYRSMYPIERYDVIHYIMFPNIETIYDALNAIYLLLLAYVSTNSTRSYM